VPSDRVVITAVFGASSGLAGLLLVFLGIVVSTFQSYSAAVPAAATAPYRRAGRVIVGGFLVGLAATAVGLAWLLSPSSSLFDAALALFCLQLLVLAVAAIGTARIVLWR